MRPRLRDRLVPRGLRTRISLYIFAALVPILVFQVWQMRQMARELEAQARQTTTHYARLVAQTHGHRLRESRHVFAALDHDLGRLASNPDRCTDRLRELLEVTHGFDIFLLVGPEGGAICASRPIQRPIDVSDRQYFRRARESERFAIGEYIVGRVSGQAVLPMGYPVMDDAGELQYMLVAGRQLQDMAAVMRDHALPADAVVRLVDGEGRLLAEQPDRGGRIGDPLADAPLRRAVLAERTGNRLTRSGESRRITGFVPLDPRFGEAFALVSIPRETLLASVDRTRRRTLAGFAALLLLTVAMTWLGLRREVFAPLRETVGWLQRFPERLHERRLPALGRSAEMQQLLLSLNHMAGAVREYNRLVESDRDALRRSNVRLERLASHDALTGSLNRYAMDRCAQAEIDRSRRYGRHLALLMLDLDRFKAINDGHGHAAGDAVLAAFAQVIRDNLRDSDSLGRYGGEEFMVLLPEADREEALKTAERLREAVEQLDIDHDGRSIRITVSIGVAEHGPDGDALDSLYRAADAAVYRAKDLGRNRVSG